MKPPQPHSRACNLSAPYEFGRDAYQQEPILPGVFRKVLPVHRWLGITLGLLFALWFASGIILSFVPFPTLATRDRISRSDVIGLEKVGVSPAPALAAAGRGPVMHLRLISVAGYPRYVFSPVGHPIFSGMS